MEIYLRFIENTDENSSISASWATRADFAKGWNEPSGGFEKVLEVTSQQERKSKTEDPIKEDSLLVFWSLPIFGIDT